MALPPRTDVFGNLLLERIHPETLRPAIVLTTVPPDALEL